MEKSPYILGVLLSVFSIQVLGAAEPTLSLLPSGTVLKMLGWPYYVSCMVQTEYRELITDMKWTGPNGQEIDESSGIKILDNQPKSLDLYIQGIAEKDVGTFLCTAVIEGNEEISAEVFFDVYRNIDFNDTPLHQTLIEGTDSKVLCPVTATPEPMIDWFKGMKPINTFSHDRFISQEDGLLIKHVTPEDEGVYRCRATLLQTGTIDYKDIKVEVKASSDNVDEGTVAEYGNIYFYDTPLHQTLIEGTDSKVLCQVTANSALMIDWLKGMEPINTSSHDRFISQEDGLLIKHVMPEDEGVYICRATVPQLGSIDYKDIKVKVKASSDKVDEGTFAQYGVIARRVIQQLLNGFFN